MFRHQDLTIVTSLYNEEEIVSDLKEYVIRLLGVDKGKRWRAVIVNNGSSDNTGPALSSAFDRNDRVTVLDNPDGTGWGDGIRAAHDFVKEGWVLVFPGDLQYPVEDAQNLIQAWIERSSKVENGCPPTYVAVRSHRQDGALSTIRGKVWSIVLRSTLSSSFVDLVSQMRLYRIGVVPDQGFPSDFLFDVCFHLELERLGLVHSTIPVQFVKRRKGTSSLGGYILGSLRALKSLRGFLASRRHIK